MIRYIESGNLFTSQAETLINPVNCEGVMGKGIALEFKKRFPECINAYKDACYAGKLVPGTLMYIRLIVQPTFFCTNRHGVVLFPTKDHWRDKSRIEWIDQGLECLRKNYHQWGIKSIAMPQIGCGLGGLEWQKVKPLIEGHLAGEPIEVEVYSRAIYDFKEKVIPKQKGKYYFAYGSNMDEMQMLERCPKAKLIGPARLAGHGFTINSRGVATIVKEDLKDASGVLWLIRKDCEESLDIYEGVKSGTYKKSIVNVDAGKGEKIEALVYIASDSRIGFPRDGYMEKVIRAAEKHGLDQIYVNELKTWLKIDKVGR